MYIYIYIFQYHECNGRFCIKPEDDFVAATRRCLIRSRDAFRLDLCLLLKTIYIYIYILVGLDLISVTQNIVKYLKLDKNTSVC